LADFETIRQQFPALTEKVFLDAACVGLAPRAATEAIRKFLDRTLNCPERSATLNHIAMDECCSRARSQAARLVNAGEDEIALVESTTHGLSISAGALPLVRGDRVLLCNLEFLEVAIPWCQKQKEIGLEIDVVPHHNGEVRVADIADRLSPRTKVVAISAVQWSNGFRVDLGALSKLCRDRKVWLVLDAIQQLGAVPIDVQRTPVDVLVCGGHKWLNSPFGLGFLYLRRDLMPLLRRPLAGYLSLETPAGGWGNYFQTPSITPVREYRFVTGARSFENGGTANYPGAVGLAESVDQIHTIGQSNIADHIFHLTDHLIAGLDAAGVQIVTPRAREHRSGIVTFSLGPAERNVAMMERLLDQHILVSVRYTSGVGGVRVSCHMYNSTQDLDCLLEAVRHFVQGG
jgi:cysteine desulfurase/selenocysteine lyase